MKILLDMNVPIDYAAHLSKRGFEALRWSDVGASDAADSEIMAYAHCNNYIVLTYDLDFSAILSVTHELKPSVVQIRASDMYAEQAADIISGYLHQYADEMRKGAILSIDLKKARLRLLPL